MSTDEQSAHALTRDAAAYALGALEDRAAEQYGRHLEECAICRAEVAAFQRVADVLPMTAPQFAAPAELRRRVLGGVVAVEGASAEGASAGHASRRTPGPRLRDLRLPRAAIALGAAVLLAAIVVSVALSGGARGQRVLRARASSPGTAELRIADGHAELIVRKLRPPPLGFIYEVWLERASGAPAPSGTLFSVTAQGAANVGVPGQLQGVREIQVTPEPDGGSREPTHAPVIVAPIS